MLVETVDSEARLNRFNRLMQELIRGNMNRNTFQPWEIEILLDIEACQIREPVKRETLRRYQKAVQRSMEKGAPMPLRLSEYLNGKKGSATADNVPQNRRTAGNVRLTRFVRTLCYSKVHELSGTHRPDRLLRQVPAEMPGLDEPPFDNHPLGQRIYENVPRKPGRCGWSR